MSGMVLNDVAVLRICPVSPVHLSGGIMESVHLGKALTAMFRISFNCIAYLDLTKKSTE